MISLIHIYQNMILEHLICNNIGYILYVFDMNYQKNFDSAQPFKVEFYFDGVVAAGKYGYALVLTNKLISISSDGQRKFDIT